MLLLFVAVMLVMGLAYQFNDAFRVWAKSYFGDYLACLLETGELPALGGTGGQSSSCSAIFKSFSLADGRPYGSNPGVGDGPSNGSGGGGDGPGDSDSDKGAKGAGESGEDSGYSSGRGRSQAGGDGASFRNRSSNSQQGGGGSVARTAKKPVYTGSTENSTPTSAMNSSRRGSSTKQKFLDGQFYTSREMAQENEGVRSSIKIGEAPAQEKRARIIIKRDLASKTEVPQDEEMSFGDFLRYFLIAAIIIALLIVLGGQFFKISQEME